MDKKKITAIISICTIIIAIIIASGVIHYLNNRIIVDNTLFVLKKDLDAEVYSKKKISEYISSIKGKIIEDKKINTERLGEQNIRFLYYDKKKRKKIGTFKINVKDKEPPLIWLAEDHYVKEKSEINLAESIMCVDNYDKKPNCKIEGEFDINTPGDYELKYTAIDKNKNKSEINFTLHVIAENTEKKKARNIEKTQFQEIVENHNNENAEVGIDVSKWQGNIDFKKVKKAGASFVMIRIGSQKGIDGEYILDPYFEKNIKSALEEDLKVGIYFYSYADSEKEAEKQADWVIEEVKQYNLQLPIVFDWECFDNLNEMELSLFDLNKVAESFLKKIEKKGYNAMLYGSKNYLNAIWKYNNYNVWLAHYTKETDYNSDYVMWQLCQDGRIDGIKGDVDINILYKKKE
ncbi:MAG: hypothetical protein HFJ38_00090 [Bacilli bacterium]|nr:hypothetical protein [Bacilli bacterium]